MTQDWIVSVLEDLRAFADQNEMPATAELLDDALLVAAAEIASRAARQTDRNAQNDRRVSGSHRPMRHA